MEISERFTELNVCVRIKHLITDCFGHGPRLGFQFVLHSCLEISQNMLLTKVVGGIRHGFLDGACQCSIVV